MNRGLKGEFRTDCYPVNHCKEAGFCVCWKVLGEFLSNSDHLLILLDCCEKQSTGNQE